MYVGAIYPFVYNLYLIIDSVRLFVFCGVLNFMYHVEIIFYIFYKFIEVI